MKRNIELEAAEALLDVGISVPILRVRIPFCRPWVLRMTMRRPRWGTYMRIVRIYLKLGVTAEQVAAMTEDDERRFFDEHAVEASRMLALTICSGYLSGLLLAPFVAWLLRWRVPREYLLEAQRRFRNLKVSRDFMNTIVWAEATNPFRPQTSHEKMGS